MIVHVYGISPSPAVAIYCTKLAETEGEPEHGTDTKQSVVTHSYIRDEIAAAAK